ncbi:hypothetical protein O6H91_04G125100 [Diphasiastrum complanatum]|uniref:Uncharacterized protein n=1 Tax=Diphasiastrum complanatum TaxID=34168 RepID=A0ACC2E146_DIPCM|nr:hypothetical protein O6H91_04G125100 [Diphasiastrum complanatum]
MSSDGVRYCFIVKWLDPQTCLVWRYQLFYYTGDNSIEMYEIKNQRIFLKRVSHPEVHLEHLYLGASVTLYSRQLVIEDYGDEFTRKHLQNLQETTLALIKPDAIQQMGQIINSVHCNGFVIKQLRMCQLTTQDAQTFYKAHSGKPFYGALTTFMSSGPCVAMELVAEDAIKRWRLLLGPTCTEKAKVIAPSSLRAQFGTDGTKNACHGSDSTETAKLELAFFFVDRTLGSCARMRNCTLCIIKPHALLEGSMGAILDLILQNFDITAMELLTFSRTNATDFYEIYKGVCSDYHAMVHELASGPFLACEVCNKKGDTNPVEVVRELCGPIDPQVCKMLRPDTIRAQFGTNKVKNAIHCTDLPEDGVLESQFIFKQRFKPAQEVIKCKKF